MLSQNVSRQYSWEVKTVHWFSNRDRCFHGLPAQTFAESGFGLGRGSEARDQRCGTENGAKADAGACSR